MRLIVCLMKFVWIIIFVVLSMTAWAKRDPTQPSTYQGTVSTDLSIRVNSILIAGARKIATVNHQLLVVGDQINGLKVTAIAANEVRFTDKQGKEIIVKLVEDLKLRK